jgi:hypothetical protein
MNTDITKLESYLKKNNGRSGACLVTIGPYKDMQGHVLGELAVLKIKDESVIAYDENLIIVCDSVYDFKDSPTRSYRTNITAAKENSMLVKMLQKAEVLPPDKTKPSERKAEANLDIERVMEPSHN